MDLDKNSYEKIINSLHEGLYFINKDRVITYWNKAAETISGFTADEVIGKSCAEDILTHIDSDGVSLCHGLCPLAATIHDSTSREAKVYMHHKDGHRVPVYVKTTTLTDKDGNVIGGVEMFTDAGTLESNEIRIKELEQLALLDKLTQLANRRYIEDELRRRFEEKQRFNTTFGVFFIDIDHFKEFNDKYGHDVGDKVLQFVSKTLRMNARPFDFYGRWGGEEFIGIVRNIKIEGLVSLGDRVRSLIESAYIVHNNEKLHVTISIGATLVKDTDDIKSVINRADQLLYRSKAAGRNRITIG